MTTCTLSQKSSCQKVQLKNWKSIFFALENWIIYSNERALAIFRLHQRKAYIVFLCHRLSIHLVHLRGIIQCLCLWQDVKTMLSRGKENWTSKQKRGRKRMIVKIWWNKETIMEDKSLQFTTVQKNTKIMYFTLRTFISTSNWSVIIEFRGDKTT